eukprot:g2691.t1
MMVLGLVWNMHRVAVTCLDGWRGTSVCKGLRDTPHNGRIFGVLLCPFSQGFNNGEFSAWVNNLRAFAGSISPVLYGQVYAAAEHRRKNPGLTFLLAGTLGALLPQVILNYVDPKAPWRVKKNIWGQVKKHPEPQSGFRLRSKTSLQYRRLKDLVRLEKKKGVITEDLRRRIKEFGKGRTPQEIKEEREEQKVRNQEKRTKKRKTSEKSEAAGSAEEEVEEEESVSQPSPVRQPRTPDGPPPAKRPQTRDTERGRAVWGRALELNLRIVALANERAQRLTIENWKLESPFQVRKLAADELVEQRGLKGTVALAAIRELWKTPNDQGKRGSNEACSSCDERRQAQLPVVQDYIKRRGLKGPALPKEKAKSKAAPKEKAKAKATSTVGRRPEELTRTTVEVRGVPKASEPSQG